MRSARWGAQRGGEGQEKGRGSIGTETLVGFLSCSPVHSRPLHPCLAHSRCLVNMCPVRWVITGQECRFTTAHG